MEDVVECCIKRESRVSHNGKEWDIQEVYSQRNGQFKNTHRTEYIHTYITTTYSYCTVCV